MHPKVKKYLVRFLIKSKKDYTTLFDCKYNLILNYQIHKDLHLYVWVIKFFVVNIECFYLVEFRYLNNMCRGHIDR